MSNLGVGAGTLYVHSPPACNAHTREIVRMQRVERETKGSVRIVRRGPESNN
jgi:hypothetical protein